MNGYCYVVKGVRPVTTSAAVRQIDAVMQRTALYGAPISNKQTKTILVEHNKDLLRATLGEHPKKEVGVRDVLLLLLRIFEHAEDSAIAETLATNFDQDLRLSSRTSKLLDDWSLRDSYMAYTSAAWPTQGPLILAAAANNVPPPPRPRPRPPRPQEHLWPPPPSQQELVTET